MLFGSQDDASLMRQRWFCRCRDNASLLLWLVVALLCFFSTCVFSGALACAFSFDFSANQINPNLKVRKYRLCKSWRTLDHSPNTQIGLCTRELHRSHLTNKSRKKDSRLLSCFCHPKSTQILCTLFSLFLRGNPTETRKEMKSFPSWTEETGTSWKFISSPAPQKIQLSQQSILFDEPQGYHATQQWRWLQWQQKQHLGSIIINNCNDD